MNDYKNKFATASISFDYKMSLQEWYRTWMYEYRVNNLRPSSLEKYNGLNKNYILNS